jgi:general secretion pathway protein F
VIDRIRDAVRGGAPLSPALERQHGGVFSRLYVNMVRAGEIGGSAARHPARLAEYLERSKALREGVINALIYPAILLVMVGGLAAVPAGLRGAAVRGDVRGLDAELPLLSARGARRWAMFVSDWWIVLLALPALALWWLDRKRREPAFRARWTTGCCGRSSPVALIARLETARLARTLGTLVRNGVPLMAALGIGRNVMANRTLAADVEAAAEEVKNGVALSTALSRGKRFPRLALQMIQVGEESGALDAMLLKTADTFEHETARPWTGCWRRWCRW